LTLLVGRVKTEWCVLARFSIWGKVHIYVWSSDAIPSMSLAPVSPDWFYLSGTGSPG